MARGVEVAEGVKLLRAVVFDLFGTLVTYPPGALHVRAIAERVGASFDDLHREWRKLRPRRDAGEIDALEALRICCREIGMTATDERLAAACADNSDFLRRVLVPRDGAVEALTSLRETGLRIGLVSDANIEVHSLWPGTPLAPLVDVAVFSSVERARKPDPALYRAVLERLEVKASECLYVGNGDGDELGGALANGMRAVLFTAPGEHPGHEAATWTGTRITDLRAVPDLIDFFDHYRDDLRPIMAP